jgi:hypothetical protein
MIMVIRLNSTHKLLLSYINLDTKLLTSLIFLYVFVPFVQKEIDRWVEQRNWSKRRADKQKLIPNEIPGIVMGKPERYGQKNFLVSWILD